MRRRGARATCFGVGLLLTLISSVALAQRIVLLRPRSSDPAILSAFAHLQGELKVHDFEVIVVDTNSGDADPDELERAAEEEDAVAAVALLRSRDAASADIWISDRVTGKTSRRTISTPPRREGPNVLAVRAVDLLRASLREFAPETKPPPDIVGAAPSRAPEHVMDWARAKPDVASRFRLEAGVLGQVTTSSFGPAYGPSIAVGYDPTHSIGLRLLFQGPLWGGNYSTSNASATMLQEQLMVEGRWKFWSNNALSSSALLAVGVHHLSVQGEATTPYTPRNDAAFAGLASLGLGAEWRFATAAAFSLHARTLALAPKPVINVGADHVGFGRPLFQIAGGLDVLF
jgi:hypothetical protein